MARRVIEIFSCPDVFSRLAALGGANLVGWSQSETGAVARSLLDVARAVVRPEDFGAVGDGVTDDTTALQNAAAALRSRGGGTIVLGNRKTYKVWSDGVGTRLFDLSNLNGCAIEGNGSTILNGSASLITSGLQYVVYCPGINGLRVSNLNFTGNGQSSLPVSASNNSDRFLNFNGGAKNIVVEGCRVTNCHAGVQCIGDNAKNYNVVVRACDFYRCFYPLSLWCTDNVVADYRAEECGRAYFPVSSNGIGCRNHRINLWSSQGYTDADCALSINGKDGLAADEENALRDIEINYFSPGKAPGTGNSSGNGLIYVTLTQPATGTAACEVRNLRINFCVNGFNSAGSAADKPGSLVQFVKRLPGGVPDTDTTRGHIVEDVVISGAAFNWGNAGGRGIVLFDTTGGMDWTGDFTRGIALRDVRITGAPAGGDAIEVNGQGAPADEPFLTLENVFVTGDLTYANVASAQIEELNVKAGNLDATSVVRRTYTPTWTGSGGNPSIGDGTLVGYWSRRGRRVKLTINLVAGATTTFGSGNYAFTAPVAAVAGPVNIGVAYALDSGTSHYRGIAVLNGGSSTIQVHLADSGAVWTSTAPFTFAANDIVRVEIEYDSA